MPVIASKSYKSEMSSSSAVLLSIALRLTSNLNVVTIVWRKAIRWRSARNVFKCITATKSVNEMIGSTTRMSAKSIDRSSFKWLKPQLFWVFLRLWLCLKKEKKFAEKRYETVDGKDISLEEVKASPKQKLDEEYILFVAKAFTSFKLKFEFKELWKWLYVLNFLTVPLNESYERVFHWFYEINGFGAFIQFEELSHSCLPNSNFIKTGIWRQFLLLKNFLICPINRS